MNDSNFDAFARHAAGAVSRRGSLRVLGGAALASAVAAPAVASARNAGKKTQQQRKRQREQCFTAITKVCESTIDPKVCEASLELCCEHFARCDVGAGIKCLFKVE